MDQYFVRIRQFFEDRATHPLFIPMVANACLLFGILLTLWGMSSQIKRLKMDVSLGVKDDSIGSVLGQAAADSDTSLRLRSLEEAKTLRETVSNKDAMDEPEKLAAVLAELDQWLVQEEVLTDFQNFKRNIAEELRNAIDTTVASFHAKAIGSEDSSEAQKLHGEAGQLIALFPISDDPDVLSLATKLSNAHSVAAARIDAIRRQRYNLWALVRVSDLLNWLEKSASSWTTKDNPTIVSRAASALGPIDPMLLEPAASQLYGLALAKAGEAISTKQQGDLASRLTDPSTHTRKTLGDF